jgi:ABC-type nickel/cobalt efflux system permease component RcnA
MIVLSGGMWWLVVSAAVLIVGVGLAIFRSHVQHQQRNRQLIEQRFWQAMQQHSKPNVQIVKDRTQLGGRGKQRFDVHRVLHHPPDRWFVYTHIEDSEPMLVPVSEEGAMAVVLD